MRRLKKLKAIMQTYIKLGVGIMADLAYKLVLQRPVQHADSLALRRLNGIKTIVLQLIPLRTASTLPPLIDTNTFSVLI